MCLCMHLYVCIPFSYIFRTGIAASQGSQALCLVNAILHFAKTTKPFHTLKNSLREFKSFQVWDNNWGLVHWMWSYIYIYVILIYFSLIVNEIMNHFQLKTLHFYCKLTCSYRFNNIFIFYIKIQLHHLFSSLFFLQPLPLTPVAFSQNHGHFFLDCYCTYIYK